MVWNECNSLTQFCKHLLVLYLTPTRSNSRAGGHASLGRRPLSTEMQPLCLAWIKKYKKGRPAHHEHPNSEGALMRNKSTRVKVLQWFLPWAGQRLGAHWCQCPSIFSMPNITHGASGATLGQDAMGHLLCWHMESSCYLQRNHPEGQALHMLCLSHSGFPSPN